MTQQTPYIGSKISLISKLDIRYEGILYTVDSKESTIALSKVRSFGTEDRNAAHIVPPQDDVYDYIIFKANDIKDLIVCETPKPPAPGLPYDPAILEVKQGGEKPAPPAPVGSERSGSANATRTSTPRNNARSPSQQQNQPQSWKNNDNKSNNSTYRQGGYQNRNNQNRQHGYEGNNKQQQPRNYESQNPNGSNNYRQGNNQQNRNYESQNRNTYNNQNNRGGPRSQNQNRGNGTRPHGPRNNLKFENDYDFEKAYEQFKETLEAIVGDVQNVKIDDSHDNDAGSVKSGGDGNDETFYDKNKSFFDSISCEALEKEEGKNTRPDWRKERLTNQETFGQQSVRSFGYRRGGFNNRGGGGYNNRGGGYGNNRQQGGYRGGYGNNRGYQQQGRDYTHQQGRDYTHQQGRDNTHQQGRDNGRQQGRENNSRQQGESKRN